MKRSLKNAVIASTILHSIAFVPFYGIVMPVQNKEAKKDMVVDYVILKEAVRVETPKKTISIRPIDTPKVALDKVVDVKPAVPAKPIESRSEAAAKRKTDERIAKKEAQIKSTKDYAGYYQFMREKIRQRLKANYRNYRKEGDVHLVFTLDSNGGLSAFGIDDVRSTGDGALREIAAISLREAAPFPAFPKALALPRMSFDVVISFLRE